MYNSSCNPCLDYVFLCRNLKREVFSIRSCSPSDGSMDLLLNVFWCWIGFGVFSPYQTSLLTCMVLGLLQNFENSSSYNYWRIHEVSPKPYPNLTLRISSIIFRNLVLVIWESKMNALHPKFIKTLSNHQAVSCPRLPTSNYHSFFRVRGSVKMCKKGKTD